EIPLDLIEATGPGRSHPSVTRPLPTPDADRIDAAAEALAACRRPLIIAGAGAHGAGQEIEALAAALGAGIILSSNAKGVIDDDGEHSLGAIGFLELLPELTADADAVIAVGTELASSDFWPEPLPLPDTVVRIDIDEVQMLTNAEVSHPILADARPATARLAVALDGRRAAVERDGAPWAGLTEALNAFTASVAGPVVIAADSTMACYYGVQTGWTARRGDRFLYPAGAGTLGYGLPAGIGATIAAPEARVIAGEGDGGAMFTIAELAAAVQARVKLILIIVDNGGYGEIRNEMADRGDAPSGGALTGPDLPAPAQARGAPGLHAEGPGGRVPAPNAAGGRDGPPPLPHPARP